MVRVGVVGIFLMLKPETDGAGIGDGFAAPLHLQDRLPVVVRYRDIGRNSAAARSREIGDCLASADRLVARTGCDVESVAGSGDCPQVIFERIPDPGCLTSSSETRKSSERTSAENTPRPTT